MHSVFYFAIATVSLSLVASLSLLLMWKQLKNQNQILVTLTNLATSKNLETFQNLQWTTMRTLDQQSQSAPVEPIPVLDDISLAHALAERNKAMGQDPNRAYNMEDDVDFATEFGLNG